MTITTEALTTYRKEMFEVMGAYADCWMDSKNEGYGKRNLHFRASGVVPRNVAMGILEMAGVKNYNLFDYNLLQKFDESCWFEIAREGSVCLYVTRQNTSVAMPTAEEVDADEMALDEAEDNSLNTFRYWWD